MDAVDLMVLFALAGFFLVKLLTKGVQGTFKVVEAKFAVGVEAHAAAPHVEVALHA